MPLKLDVKRKLCARSDRVKCVDQHPTEPWLLAALFSGHVHVWNVELQQVIKTFEVCDLPVRAARFVARKNWLITGSDDFALRVYNYNTLERVHQFEAHSDYIRSIAVHPTNSFVLTSSDDMLIKLWDWDKNWACAQVFDGHTHYVMQLVFNPKDNNTFASASLDKTVKVWSLGQQHANFTLEGHDKGINCVDYYCGGDKPYLVTGADDRLVKIWDYQTKTCVQTLEGHAQNISAVAFHPELPIILTGSEDGTVRVWHANTYRLESTLNYGMERVWCINCLRGQNTIALGYDEGTILLKLGREEPAMSMDASGKVVFAKHSEMQQTNVKGVFAASSAEGEAGLQDGERLPLSVKNMGTCEIYPQTLQHNTNGRFVVVCGDGEYIVYTSMALRNKSFGHAQEFVWAQQDATMYATREGSSVIKVFKNFKEFRTLRPELGVEQIYGGWLLGVRSSLTSLAFYNWETGDLVRRIELSASPNAVHWNERGQLLAIVSEESTFILRFNAAEAENASPDSVTEDGIEAAFELVDAGELNDTVKTATWVGDCLLYVNGTNRLVYYVGGELVTVAHLDRPMYLLGYLPKENRAFLSDRDVNIVSHQVLLSVLEYQTAVMRKDFETADAVLPSIPRDQRTRVAHFLERRGFHQQALAVTTDPEHKFELALQLGKLDMAYELAKNDEENTSQHRWKQLAEVASRRCEFALAQECLSRAQDFGALLLLASSCGNASILQRVAHSAHSHAQDNVAFLASFLMQDLEGCVKLLVNEGRLAEATMFCRTYLPSRVPTLVEMWRDRVKVGATAGATSVTAARGNEKLAQALSNPLQYENLFPGWRDSIKVENYLKSSERAQCRLPPARVFPKLVLPVERDALGEMRETEAHLGTSFDARCWEEKREDERLPRKSDEEETRLQNGFTTRQQEEHEEWNSSSVPPVATGLPAGRGRSPSPVVAAPQLPPQLYASKEHSPQPLLHPRTEIVAPPPAPAEPLLSMSPANVAAPSSPILEPKKSTEEEEEAKWGDEDDEDAGGGGGVGNEEDDELERDIANMKLDADDLNWDDDDEEETNS